MKRKFINYVVIWAALVILFNVIIFIIPSTIAGESKYTASFWVGYVFIKLSFAGQLAVTWYTMKDESDQKAFYNFPLTYISYISVFAMLLVGILTMLVPGFPAWIGIILCLTILVFSVVALALAHTAIDKVEKTEHKIKGKTHFINSLRVDLDALLIYTENAEIRTEIKKASDAAHYSDPVSHEDLLPLESKILSHTNGLREAVNKEDIESIRESVNSICILLNDRNAKCKLLK